jgi:hypothetical protein
LEDERVKEAKSKAPFTYEFYRGYFKGIIDALTDSNIEDTHPGLDALIDHAVASIICDAFKEFSEKR